VVGSFRDPVLLLLQGAREHLVDSKMMLNVEDQQEEHRRNARIPPDTFPSCRSRSRWDGALGQVVSPGELIFCWAAVTRTCLATAS